MVCPLEIECCVRAVISTLGSRCLKTLWSVTPEPPGGYRPHPNQAFLNVHGTAPCGDPQAASRLDSPQLCIGYLALPRGMEGPRWGLAKVVLGLDRGVEGPRPLLRLRCAKSVRRLWAKIPGWSKAGGWTGPGLAVSQNWTFQDRHADGAGQQLCSGALVWSFVLHGCRWCGQERSLLPYGGVCAACCGGLQPDYEWKGVAQKPPIFMNVICVTRSWCCEEQGRTLKCTYLPSILGRVFCKSELEVPYIKSDSGIR